MFMSSYRYMASIKYCLSFAQFYKVYFTTQSYFRSQIVSELLRLTPFSVQRKPVQHLHHCACAETRVAKSEDSKVFLVRAFQEWFVSELWYPRLMWTMASSKFHRTCSSSVRCWIWSWCLQLLSSTSACASSLQWSRLSPVSTGCKITVAFLVPSLESTSPKH